MENLGWGLQMTAVGMGLVFALLALLWGLLALVLRLDVVPAAEAPAKGGAATGDGDGDVAVDSAAGPAAANGMDADLVAAITVAVLTHRAVRRREGAPFMRINWPGSLLYASRWVATGRARQTHSWQRRGR
jgi:glutaconyl-CoA/methylmalonyl-CoA decarboxylase subunit delta